MRLHGLAVVLLGLGCREPTSVDYDLHEFQVTTSVSSTVAREREPTTVSVTVTNVGTVPRSLFTGCLQGFVVETADGTRVGPAEIYCLTITGPDVVELAPGEQLAFEARWAGEAYRPTGTEPRLVPAGTYLLRGMAWPYPKVTGRPGFRMEPVLSDPIPVTFAP